MEARKLTPEELEAKIKEKHYWNVPGTTMTVCALKLENGYCVIGTSGAVIRYRLEVGENEVPLVS